MKKFKYIFLVLICVLFLSGCVKNHTTMSINKDKSMTYENEILFSNELGDDMTTLLQSEEYESSGYKVTVVKEEGYSGIKITKNFDNIDNYSNNNGEEVSISNFYDKDFNKDVLFKKETSFLKDTYIAKFKYNVDSSEYTNSLDEDVSLDENNTDDETSEDDGDTELNETQVENYLNLMGEMEFTFNVNLPSKSDSNNATNVTNNGKTLTWDLSMDNDSNIEFTFSIYNTTHIIILCSIVFVLIVVVIIILVLFKKKKDTSATLIHKDYDPSIESIINNEQNNTLNNNVEVTNEIQSHTDVPNVQNNIPNEVVSNEQNNINNVQ